MRLDRAICIGLIRVYQYGVSPILPRTCRYAPTCSDYASEAIARHGAILGCWLAARRLLRCQPWGGHGYDPVPDRIGWSCPHHHHHPSP